MKELEQHLDDIYDKDCRTDLEQSVLDMYNTLGADGLDDEEYTSIRTLLLQIPTVSSETQEGLLKLQVDSSLSQESCESNNTDIFQDAVDKQSTKGEIYDGIKNRGDVSSRAFFSKVDFHISGPDYAPDRGTGEEILEHAFTIAFKSEMKSPKLQKNLKNFTQRHSIIQEEFRRNITGLSGQYIDKLVFLCVVESNYDPSVKSPVGATGLWQIMPDTGKRYYTGDLVIEDALQDVSISTNIAARYLNDVIQSVRKKFPDATDEQVFKMTLREYNGAWNTKLKPEYRVEAFSSARSIYIQLDVLEGINESTFSEKDKISQAKTFIKVIQDTYFDKSDLIAYIEEKGLDSDFSKLLQWSRRYFDVIIKQQLMYPNQVIGAYNAYNELKSS